ncbi:MAG: DNA gyrase inhibitor YacG [Pseudomonadota bacterium]
MSGSGPTNSKGQRGSKCPVCGKPTAPTHRPFCSAHCGYVDLNRWLGGNYAIPAVEADDLDGIDPEAPES